MMVGEETQRHWEEEVVIGRARRGRTDRVVGERERVWLVVCLSGSGGSRAV